MAFRFRWHRTMTIALAAAFVLAVLVLEREATLLTRADADQWPLGWLAVLAVGGLCFACGASFRSAEGRLESVHHEDAPD
jgi:MFS-type transporter involved in bile tolerance (Atg22 family)